MRFLLFPFLLCVISCTDVSKTTQTKKSKLSSHESYSSEELKEDFNLLTRSLREIHPDLYRVSTKEQIDSKILEIEAALYDSLSYLQFLKLIAPLLTDIGCINTQWGHAKAYIDYRNENIPIFPIEFKIEDGRFMISENWSTNANIRKGDEILELNAVTTKDYLAKNYPLLPIDGKIRTLQDRWLEAYFPNHHSNFWEQPDTFNLLVKSKDGSTRMENVQARLKAEIIPANTQAALPLSFHINDSVGEMRIETFNLTRIKQANQDYYTFLDIAFRQIKTDVKLLVIDLRDNSWGNMDAASLLLEYLTNRSFKYVERFKVNQSPKTDTLKPIDYVSLKHLNDKRKAQENNYNGKLYMITNGWNVNAAGYFCAKINDRPNTYFFGEKPGSTLFGMNFQSHLIELPNTEISVYIPQVQVIAKMKNYNDVEGIKISADSLVRDLISL